MTNSIPSLAQPLPHRALGETPAPSGPIPSSRAATPLSRPIAADPTPPRALDAPPATVAAAARVAKAAGRPLASPEFLAVLEAGLSPARRAWFEPLRVDESIELIASKPEGLSTRAQVTLERDDYGWQLSLSRIDYGQARDLGFEVLVNGESKERTLRVTDGFFPHGDPKGVPLQTQIAEWSVLPGDEVQVRNTESGERFEFTLGASARSKVSRAAKIRRL